MTSKKLIGSDGGARRVLEYSDERMIPESSGEDCFWQHIFRYRFAAKYVGKKRVLDIACGEGYGTSALQRAGAVSVIGVDVSDEVCRHAAAKYGVDAKVGNAEQIPLPDGSVDIVVSFETIEHVANPEKFLVEVKRVLKASGVLIVSTPNKRFYDPVGGVNRYHCSEMTCAEFVSLLRGQMGEIEFFGQSNQIASWHSKASLWCENSPWLKIPGFRFLRRLFCPSFNPAVTRKFRTQPEEAILAKGNLLESILDPHWIRKMGPNELDNSMMIIAVCRLK